MSKSEDYLDGLLNSALGKNEPELLSVEMDTKDEGKETIPDMPKSEKEFLEEFEKELLSDGDDTEFIRQFEMEIDGNEEPFQGEVENKESLLDNLDGIVNSVKEKLEADQENLPDSMPSLDSLEPLESTETMDAAGTTDKETGEETGSADIMIDTLGNLGGMDLFSDVSAEESSADNAGDDEIMSLLESEGNLSEAETMVQEEEKETVPEEQQEEGAAEEETGKKKRRKRKEKKKEKKQKENTEEQTTEEQKEGKQGFLQKMSKLFFGEDEDEGDNEKKTDDGKAASHDSGENVQELTDENIDLLAQLGNMGASAPEPEAAPEQTEDKKKKKKEKKPKKEKPKKEKKPKPKKEKKPKPPKEPDNTPPLPKKPVILIFVMVISFMVLVLLGINLFGYSYQVSEAKSAYDTGDYEAAYQDIYGVEVKESDALLYQKCLLMANVSGEFSAYQTFLENGIYDMALDSLIRTIGRCEKYRPDAEEYDCIKELETLESQAQGALAAFGISGDEALSLYDMSEDREEYSTEIYRILIEAGYEVAE